MLNRSIVMVFVFMAANFEVALESLAPYSVSQVQGRGLGTKCQSLNFIISIFTIAQRPHSLEFFANFEVRMKSMQGLFSCYRRIFGLLLTYKG